MTPSNPAANDDSSILLNSIAPGQIENSKALELFFKKLKSLESGETKDTLRILQIGDSHTAGDRMSGKLRALFQKKFGNAGRGMLAPGKPWKYFHPTDVQTGQSEKWLVSNSFHKSAHGIFGVSGFRTSSADAEDSMWLVADTVAEEKYSIAIESIAGPGHGSFDLKVDGKKIARCVTEAPKTGMKLFRFDVKARGSKMTVDLSPTGNGPVHLLSWTVEGDKPGVVYDSQGIVGATVDIFSKWDFQVIKQELAFRRPSLILIAFGTNEGFNDWLGLKNYEKRFTRYLLQIKNAAPGANILVIGPPDADRISSRCLNPRDSKGRRQKKIPPEKFKCGELSEKERKDYKFLFPRKGEPNVCRWHPALHLDEVRQIQRRVALQNGCAFWDWSQIMGGPCGAHQWFLKDPPYIQPDHVHFTRRGYRHSATKLFNELMRLYNK